MRWALLLCFLMFCAGCNRSANGPLRVGMEMKYPPFEMRDAHGDPAGVGVDLARALGESLGRQVEFSDMPFDGLIPALKTGQIDMVISSMTATDERRQSIDFSDPYLRTGLCLLVPKNSDIQSAADLDKPGRKVAVLKSTTGHVWATKNLKQAEPLVLGAEAAAALEVSQGKADAFIYDQMSTLRNALKYKDTVRPILKPFQEEGWAIALAKGKDDLRAKVNAFIKDYRAKGGFEKLGNQWLGEQKAEFSKLGVPFVF